MMTDDAIDAAIRNLGTLCTCEQDYNRAIFRAGSVAGQAAAVPREPTEAMIDAASSCKLGTGVPEHSAAIWRAMYDAALGAGAETGQAAKVAVLEVALTEACEQFSSLANLPIENDPVWIADSRDNIDAINRWYEALGREPWPFGCVALGAGAEGK